MVCDEATHQVRDRGQEAMPSMAKIWIFLQKKRGEKEGLKQRGEKEREILAGWFIPQMPALAMTGPG